jgi:hypothetical protein
MHGAVEGLDVVARGPEPGDAVVVPAGVPEVTLARTVWERSS